MAEFSFLGNLRNNNTKDNNYKHNKYIVLKMVPNIKE